MSGDTITLKLTERKELGKAVKALRRAGQVPANIYERGKESTPVSGLAMEVAKVYNQAGKHHPVELMVGSKKHLAMIKDVDVDPVKGRLRHIAFHAIKQDEVVTAEVPVKIEGDIPAEKISLMVLHTLDTVEVEALPADLPNELFIDGAKLNEVGDKVTVADIKVPANVKIMTDPEHAVAIVEQPKDQIAEADAALAEMEAMGENAESEVESEEGSVDADEPAADQAQNSEDSPKE
jgi:large subunit ribosomal protein L25